MMEMQCRIWWPKHLLSCKPDSTLLFGWFLHSSFASLDIVVANADPLNRISASPSQSNLQTSLRSANGKMSIRLQDQSTYSVLGYCAADRTYENLNVRSSSIRMEEVASSEAINHSSVCPQDKQELFQVSKCINNHNTLDCGCHKLDRVLELHRQSSIRTGSWIQLTSDSSRFISKGVHWLPKLHHMHSEGLLLSNCDVHVIIYEQPTFSSHHFSLTSWNSSMQIRRTLKRPKWLDELHHKKPLSDLDTTFLALNNATSAKMTFESCLVSTFSYKQFNEFIHSSEAVFVASFVTLFYAILQFCHGLLSYGSETLFYKVLSKVFRYTWKNVHIRCCQLLYWPVFLQGSSYRSDSSVEYSHRAALRKHSMWSSIAFDVMLGNIVGYALLIHAEAVYFWVSQLAHGITDDLLRSGCVWLMGVPAGFKLNNELAGVLGIISLNAIHIWSTVLGFTGFLFVYFIKGLAISGIILGVTVPAAICIDMLRLVTSHLSSLHWVISLLYSLQIQAMASLWRLFRGRKWNPLRQRFDSYEYSVKQHVVGSLLFTPVLLLLPTTSVFYIFFTIMDTTISCFCILIEVIISILHATPYAEIFLWMLRPRRFPSGVWFEIILAESSKNASPNHGFCGEEFSTSDPELMKSQEESNLRQGFVVSFLHSNLANIGQIVLPHYRKVFQGVPLSSIASSAYGIFSGTRMPPALHTGLPPILPWFCMSCREYWKLCYDLVIARKLGEMP